MSRLRGEARFWLGDRGLAYLLVGLAVACVCACASTHVDPSGAGGSLSEGTAGSPVTTGGSAPATAGSPSASGGSAAAGMAGASVAGSGGALLGGTGGTALAGTGGTPVGTAGGVDGAETAAKAKLQFDGSVALRRVRR